MRDNRPYSILLIGAAGSGSCQRLTHVWADAEQAMSFGADMASEIFDSMPVEIIIVHTMTRQIVLQKIIEV